MPTLHIPKRNNFLLDSLLLLPWLSSNIHIEKIHKKYFKVYNKIRYYESFSLKSKLEEKHIFNKIRKRCAIRCT